MLGNGIVFLLQSGKVGTMELVTTDLLSQNTFAAPSIGILIIRNFYRNDSNISTHMRIAMNSQPKDDASTVFCNFECHITGAQFK
jgi:hypothetical protein